MKKIIIFILFLSTSLYSQNNDIHSLIEYYHFNCQTEFYYKYLKNMNENQFDITREIIKCAVLSNKNMYILKNLNYFCPGTRKKIYSDMKNNEKL